MCTVYLASYLLSWIFFDYMNLATWHFRNKVRLLEELFLSQLNKIETGLASSPFHEQYRTYLSNTTLNESNLRGYSQTTCYTENQVFCFDLFTIAHLFGFHPNTWISKHLVFFTAVWRIFLHLFIVKTTF
jgi:hypothetical protein